MIIECPECGEKNQTTQSPQPGKRYRCGKCGASITFLQPTDMDVETIPSSVTEKSENTSGQGSLAVIPKEIVGWNWGAFLLGWIWGIGNRVWLALLALLPFGFIMNIVLGIKGNEWAWRNKKWDSITDFKTTQRTWAIVGLVLLIPYFIWQFAVLAAVIIPNVGRFIGAGEEEAKETELANVQAAVHAMMVDNELAWLPNPVTVATNDMSAFPDATSVCGIDKLTDYYGNPYKMNFDKDGYILFQHDITGDGAQIRLVNYLASQYTMSTYTVDVNGAVTQVAISTQAPTVTQVAISTQAPTVTPETAPGIVQEKLKDIESIMGRAEGLGIHVEAVAHEGESMTITCEASDYTIFKNYVIALEESGRFSTVTPPAEKFSYVSGGTIKLVPKYQHIDMPAVYYEVNLALAPMTDRDAIAILVGIAEGSGIDIGPNADKLRIPSATIRQVRANGNTYQVLSFRNIQLQGDYEDVIAFISDLDSRKTLKTMILKRVLINQVDIYGNIETIAIVDVDIYTIES